MLASLTRLFHRWPVRPLGSRGEALAARYLRKKGYRILMCNYQSGAAEIDIVALDADTLVFVEVKTRRSEAVASPEMQVNFRKQRQISKAARSYIRYYKTPPRTRFDVVAIVWPESHEAPLIRHHQAAFQAAI